MTAAAQHLSPFLEEEYVPNRNLLQNYHYMAAAYLTSIYKWDYKTVLELVEKVFVPNQNGYKEAKFRVFKKNKYGDRVPDVMPAREFFQTVQDNNWHLSPSFVAYTHTNQEQSINSIGTETFIEFRRLYKGKMKGAISAGDKEAAQAFDEIQKALKIFNNAQSGAMSSSGTPLNNKSGHTTLTSICRSLTSVANLMNERLITGNRLLLSYNKSMELFISTLAFAKRDKIQAVIDKYQMSYATVDQVMDMVKRCSAYYWNNKTQIGAIREFMEALSPLELTIILCTMDLRGLYTTNKELVKRFFDEWCLVPEMPASFENVTSLKPANDDYKTLCTTKLGKKATAEQSAYLNSYHVSLEVKWRDFIEAFLKADIPPSGVFSVKELVRENVVTSDTDSMIYSVDAIIDDYITDKKDELAFNGVLTYFIRCIAVDQHARLSVNMNVARKFRHRLNMKNEYLFSAYFTTSMSKHYYALQLMLEGILYDDPKLELKGVHLRGIKIALKVREFTNKLMRDALDALYNNKQMDAPAMLKGVADLERLLFEELESGGWSWLTKNGIKEESAYSNADSSIYFYHEMWKQVFAETYGDAPELPYRAYKVNVTLDNKTKVKQFTETYGESDVVKKMMEYIEARGSLTAIYVPIDMIESIGGIPKEILPIVDTRSLIAQNYKSIYAILESLGLYIMNSKVTRLVSDEH